MGKCRTLILAGLILILASAVVTAGNIRKDPQDARVNRAVFQVENLTCGACFSKINQALGSIDGFSGMGANLLRKMVAVDFNPPLTPEKIGKIITGLGYPASLDTVGPLEEKETFAYMKSRRSGISGGCCGGSVPAPSACLGSGSGQGCIPPESSPSNTDI